MGVRVCFPTGLDTNGTLRRSDVRHKVKHRRVARRFLMRLPRSFHAQYGSSFSFYLSLMRPPPPPPPQLLPPQRTRLEPSISLQLLWTETAPRWAQCASRWNRRALRLPSHFHFDTPDIYLLSSKLKNTQEFKVATQEPKVWTLELIVFSISCCFCPCEIIVWLVIFLEVCVRVWVCVLEVIAGYLSDAAKEKKKVLLAIHYRPSSNEKLGPIKIRV